MKVVVMEKRQNDEPVVIDERDWSADMIAALQHANYLTLAGREYEMLEGRLNLDRSALELLVTAAAD